jgi:hypothetical protein
VRIAGHLPRPNRRSTSAIDAVRSPKVFAGISTHRVAAVDRYDCAIDEAGPGLRKKRDQPPDLFRQSPAADRRALRIQIVVELARFESLLQRVGQDVAGSDRVGGDPLARDFHRERARQADDRRLRRRIAYPRRKAEQAEHRRNVDDAPEARALHSRDRRLAEQECAAHVDRQHLVEVGGRHVANEGEARRHDAGVVHQHARCAQRMFDRTHRGFDRRFVGNVGGETGRVDAELHRQPACGVFGVAQVEIYDGDFAADLRQLGCRRKADALRAAGDGADDPIQTIPL